jgi:hypothetical protein
MPILPLEIVLGIAGLVLTIVVLVLDKADKLKGASLIIWLLLAGFLTLPIAVANPFVADSPPAWKWWRAILMISVVTFTYWALAIWVISPDNLLTPANDPDAPEYVTWAKNLKIAPDTFRVYLGKWNIGYMTNKSSVVLRIAGKDMLVLRRSGEGISVDAKIFGLENSIIAEIKDNKFFINEKSPNYFRMDRPDDHTIIVYNQNTDEVLHLRYINSHAFSISGVFRYSGRPEVDITDAGILIGGRPWMQYCTLGDTVEGSAGMIDIP